jgi:hypothetical protein
VQKDENILSRIKGLLGDGSANLSILEHNVGIETQVEYFDFSKTLNKVTNPDEVIAEEAKLYDEDIAIADKKNILASLASISKAEAFRIIQKFSQSAPDNLKDWSIMALQESRMLLESELLDEQQVYISTGLGGKGGKLRYFIVIFSANQDIPLTGNQKELVESEFLFSLKAHGCEIEDIVFYDRYLSLTVLMPMSVTLREPYAQAISECNSLGNFLKPEFLMTNVKKLTDHEIVNIVAKGPEKGLDVGSTKKPD